MKRYDHLYEKIYDLENLRKAHQHAKKGKGWYREVQEIDKEPDKYLKQIQEMLINHTYKTSDYEVFYKQDGKKLRKIYKLPYFPDRICQWAILQIIEPCIINNLTADTYSAIPNRGIHKGLTKLQSAMWNDPEECRYCLKLDARHYYQSINHDLLKEKYSRMFNDNELLWLLNEIIDSIETAEIEDLTAIYDLNDKVNGILGDGSEILAIELYYITPDGYKYKMVHYRVSVRDNSNFYSEQIDTLNASGMDGFAGDKKRFVDKFQAWIE